jgi:hypothetical protein
MQFITLQYVQQFINRQLREFIRARDKHEMLLNVSISGTNQLRTVKCHCERSYRQHIGGV